MPAPDPFDPQALRLNGALAAPSPPGKARPTRLPRHRRGEWFLRALIPWRWLEAAGRLPGKTLALSLCLWREAGRKRNGTVALNLSRCGLGLNVHSARRALRALES